MKCTEILLCCCCCCCCSATGWHFAAPTWADTSIWSPQTSCASEWVSEWVKERSLCRPPTSRGCNWLRLRLQTRGRSGLQSQRMLMSMTRQLPDSTGNSCCCAWGVAVAVVVVDSSPHLRPEALQMICNCSCSWFTCNLIKCHRFFRFIRQWMQGGGGE